jgi:amphi-Trp domain-containing protein
MMEDRDVERNCDKGYFIGVLRRLADSIEYGEPFRIQVVNKRFKVPLDATLSIEHEVEDGVEELELQLRWPQQ